MYLSPVLFFLVVILTKDQFRIGHHHGCSGRNGFFYPCVAADDRAFTDNNIAENRRFGVNDDIVFDGRMTFAAFDNSALLILAETKARQALHPDRCEHYRR